MKLIDVQPGRFDELPRGAQTLRFVNQDDWANIKLDSNKPGFNVETEWKQAHFGNLIEIWFKNFNGQTEPFISCETAEAWLIKTAELVGAHELHFRERFAALEIDNRSSGINSTGNLVYALVSFVKLA